MAEKRMAIVAKAFGVELNEEFHLVNEGGLKEHICRLTEERMERLTAGEWMSVSGLLERMLMGEYTVEPVEWKPKVGEEFWTFWGEQWYVRRQKNSGTFESELKIASNLAFRTQEEALKARPTAYELITGKKWEEKNDKVG